MQWGYRQLDKEQHLVKCSEKALLIVDVAKGVGWSRLSVSGLQMLMVMVSAHATCAILDICKKSDSLTTFYRSTGKIGAADLVTMLNNSLVPRPHPLMRRNCLVNQVGFLRLAHPLATV